MLRPSGERPGRASERGGVLANVFAGLFFAGVLVLAGLFFLGWQFSRGFHVETRDTASGKAVKVETPIGSLRVNSRESVDARSAGIPVYPRAELSRDDAKSATIQLDLGDEHADLHVVAAVYRTEDSVDAVKEFYKKELPHAILTKRGLEYTEGGFKRIIVIERSHGHTRIALASFGEPASN